MSKHVNINKLNSDIQLVDNDFKVTAGLALRYFLSSHGNNCSPLINLASLSAK